MTKRILSCILTVVMLIGLLPTTVFAAGGDKWDGTADTSWYDPNNPLTEYDIRTAEQLAGLAELVSGETTFDGVTFTLMNDLDLYCEDTTEAADGDPLSFRPVGDKSKNGKFEGIFDGNGKTISNLYQNGWDLGYDWYHYGSYGLFGNINDATIKNLTITGAESYIEGGDVGGITGSATGDCVFENITITDSDIATYNNGCGGIIGWAGAGNYTFVNVTIADSVVLAGLWGSFDSSIGGIMGQLDENATATFENVNVACRLDAYNDVTASYKWSSYRMCGMLIGRVMKVTKTDGGTYIPNPAEAGVVCNNVTVIYGNWANYHYCWDGSLSYGCQRVEPGYAYDGVDTANYPDAEIEEIVFDQIFGGPQSQSEGYYGLATFDGVTVYYPEDFYTVSVITEGNGIATGSGSVLIGTAATLTAEAAEGYRFVRWLKDGSEFSTAATITFVADSDCELVAVFEEIEIEEEELTSYNWILMMLFMKKFEITTETTEGGEITFDGDFATTDEGYAKVIFKQDITYTIKADDGYMISDVLVDGESVGAVNEYTLENVVKEHTISVVFAKISD